MLGPGVPGLDVTDPNFDIDAAIDASAAADPGITGTAGIRQLGEFECMLTLYKYIEKSDIDQVMAKLNQFSSYLPRCL